MIKSESVSFFMPDDKIIKNLNSFFSTKKSKTHELYLDKFKSLLELKEYLDNNLLENNTIHFAHIGRKMYMILNGISCFKTLISIVSITNYHRLELKTFNAWGSIAVMSMKKTRRRTIFYKDINVNVYSDDMVEKIYGYVIPKKKKRRRKK